MFIFPPILATIQCQLIHESFAVCTMLSPWQLNFHIFFRQNCLDCHRFYVGFLAHLGNLFICLVIYIFSGCAVRALLMFLAALTIISTRFMTSLGETAPCLQLHSRYFECSNGWGGQGMFEGVSPSA